jgi:cation diffusion facilitator family transporter
VLALLSVAVGAFAVARLAGWVESEVDPVWWAFAAIAVVIAIDLMRMRVSLRAARLYRSDALLANAIHFGSDLAGTVAVLAGLIAASAGYPGGDSIAALFVAALVLVAATRLIRRNVDVLMDRAPASAVAAAREAIGRIDPPVDVRRLRLRQAAGRSFVDVVIGVSPEAGLGQAHAAADRVEDAVERALPESDVVVHVEPHEGEAAVRERVRAAAMSVPGVREIHNLSVLELDGRDEASLHLKLPGDMPLEEAHEVAEQVEREIMRAVPEIAAVQTHIEPLTEPAPGQEVAHDSREVERIVLEATGQPPRETRFLDTDEGLIVFLTLGLDPGSTLADAHELASGVEERVRRALPGVADVIVHTEP